MFCYIYFVISAPTSDLVYDRFLARIRVPSHSRAMPNSQRHEALKGASRSFNKFPSPWEIGARFKLHPSGGRCWPWNLGLARGRSGRMPPHPTTHKTTNMLC